MRRSFSMKLLTMVLGTSIALSVLTTGTVGQKMDVAPRVVYEDIPQVGSMGWVNPLTNEEEQEYDCRENERLIIQEDSRSIIGRVTRNCEAVETPIITISIYNNRTDSAIVAGTITVEVKDGAADPEIVAVPVPGGTPQPETESTQTPITEKPPNPFPIPNEQLTGKELSEIEEDRASPAHTDTLSFETEPRESPDFIDIKFRNIDKEEFTVVVTVDSNIGKDTEIFTLVADDPDEKIESNKN